MNLKNTPKGRCAYMIIEALVYISIVFVLLGIGYAAVYRSIDRSVALRRNADDITAALHAGERWRADIRSATVLGGSMTNIRTATLQLAGAQGLIAYRFETNGIFRRTGSNQWVCLLSNVKWSDMKTDRRQLVTAWRWDFELLPYQKNTANTNRIHPVFSFLAVPQKTSL